jgi:hypothetical protein
MTVQHAARNTLMLTVLGLSIGCAKPSEVVTIKPPSPTADGFTYYTIETYYGHGAVSNDFTNIYAHFPVGDKTDKQLVMHGEYLQGTKITWIDENNVAICIPDGAITSTFRNVVALNVGSVGETKHHHLQEHCQT